MAVTRCWIKSKILPVAMEAGLLALYGRMRNDKSDFVKSVTDDFKK